MKNKELRDYSERLEEINQVYKELGLLDEEYRRYLNSFRYGANVFSTQQIHPIYIEVDNSSTGKGSSGDARLEANPQ